MKSNEEILAEVIDVDVKSIKLHKSSTVRVDEALEAMGEVVKLFAILDISNALPFAYNYCPICGNRTVKFRNKSRCIDINCKSNDC